MRFSRTARRWSRPTRTQSRRSTGTPRPRAGASRVRGGGAKNSREDTPYAWYIRIPDVVAWLRHVRAGLERNLVGTPGEGYTGALEISFYRSGVRLVLERGAVVSIDEWYDDDAKIRFTREAFTHLLCGRRGCRELTAMFADCSAPHIESVVLDSLFPPFKGLLWAVN